MKFISESSTNFSFISSKSKSAVLILATLFATELRDVIAESTKAILNVSFNILSIDNAELIKSKLLNIFVKFDNPFSTPFCKYTAFEPDIDDMRFSKLALLSGSNIEYMYLKLLYKFFILLASKLSPIFDIIDITSETAFIESSVP